MFLRLLATLFASVAAYAVYLVLKAVYAELVSPFRLLPGPKSTHWFWGNLKDMVNDKAFALDNQWFKQYGRTIKIHLFFGKMSLRTADIKAMQHILSHTQVYQKSAGERAGLRRVVGPGILAMEGDAHKQQRKIMNPAFGAPQVRELTSIFVDTSIQLRDIWATQAARNGGSVRVEALSWLSKATLDIIGLAGFNYHVNALKTESHDTPDELAQAFDAVFARRTGFTMFMLLQLFFPVLGNIPTKRNNTIKSSQATMMRIGRQLLEESKQEIAENGTFETGRGRDLLTLLVRANTSKEIPESQRMSDEEVLAQVPTFLVAGHETTSTAVTWALFALTQDLDAQTRLREELFTLSTDNPTMDELDSLPYLECVVREVLRLYAPVPVTSRMATRDDILPLATPVTDANGTVHESIRVRKGDNIRIPIHALNCDEEIWGPDAKQFVPARWSADADKPISSAIPGVWGHMMTFLGGPRSCIGFRFSLVETKALLFTLVRGFEFELAVPVADIGKEGNAIVVRPIVLSDMAAGNQLPLLIKPVVR
ncbi:cytochrome P450 [Mycena crocata]|nr:cytochrome P450 [Mycena crocata]